MENSNSSSVPEIFIFSIMCKVLPYYSKLPKWMWLLNLLNSETRNLWRSYREKFINCNDDSKLMMDTYHNGLFLPVIRYYKFRQEFYSHYYIIKRDIKRFSTTILSCLDEKNFVLFDNSTHNGYYVDMHFISFSTLQKYIPAILCPNFVAKSCTVKIRNNWPVYSYNDNYKVYEIINEILREGAVFVSIIQEGVYKFYPMHSTVMPIDFWYTEERINSQIERYTQCPIRFCCCKPRTLLTGSFSDENSINIRKTFSAIEELKEVVISDQEYWTEYRSLNNLQNFMKAFPDVKIKHSQIDFDTDKEISNYISLRSSNFFLITRDGVTPVKCDFNKIMIECNVLECIIIDDEAWILVDLCSFFSKKLVFQYDTIDCDEIVKCEYIEDCIEYLNTKLENEYCMLFNLNDIALIESYTIDWMTTLSESKILKSIEVILYFGEFEIDEATEYLLSVPNNVDLIFMISFENSFPSANDKIWRFIFENKGISIKYHKEKHIKIVEKVEGYNFNDMRRNSFKISINSKEKIVRFRTLYKMIKNTLDP